MLFCAEMIRRPFFCATVFCHHMCFFFAFAFLTRFPHMHLSLCFQSNQPFDQVEPLHNFYCWKRICCWRFLLRLCSCFLRSSSVHAMSNKVSRLSRYVRPLTKRHYLFLWARNIDGKGVVLRKCDWGKKYRQGNLWQRWEGNAMDVKHKEKKKFPFFCGLVIFSINTRKSWRTFAELHDGTIDGESSCLVSKTWWNKTVSMSPQNSKPRSSCLLTSTVLSLVVCVAILSCLLRWRCLGLFRLRRLSLGNPSRVSTWVAKISLWVLQGFPLRIKWVQ